jgi:Glycosyl hydrolases family 25
VTLFYPDVSEYTPNVDPSKYPILIARATLSDRVADPTYGTFKARAAAAGTVFAAYHWLNHGNLAAQARWCFQHVGPDVPVMIDAEDVAGNTGYNGPLTIDDILGFAAEYRALGGICSLDYLPFWYWAGPMGAPHRLGELEAAGLGLVSSNYPNAGYTDNGPGWAPYYPGAPAPVQWQYTSTPIDMNAFRGTVADFAALIFQEDAVTPEEIQAIAQAVAAEVQIQIGLWRLDALMAGADTVRGGPYGPGRTDGQPPETMWLVQAVKDVQAKVGRPAPVALTADDRAAIIAGVVTGLATDVNFMAAVAKAVNDDAAERLKA